MENEWELVQDPHPNTLPYLAWKYRILYHRRTLMDLSYLVTENNLHRVFDTPINHPLLENKKNGKLLTIAKDIEITLKKYGCVCCFSRQYGS